MRKWEETGFHLLVGLEEAHCVVTGHGSKANSASIPPLPGIPVINSSLLNSVPFFSPLTVQSPRGGPFFQFHIILSLPSRRSSLNISIFVLSLFILSGSRNSNKGQQKGPFQKIQATWSRIPEFFSSLFIAYCTILTSKVCRMYAQRLNDQTCCCYKNLNEQT